MSEIGDPNEASVTSRLLRAQELGQERVRNTELATKIVRLEQQLAQAQARRDRAATLRFVVLCTVVLLGLAAVVYLQIDSRGSGQLRADLIAQCEVRNGNTLALAEKLRAAASHTVDTDMAEDLIGAADTLRTYDCQRLQ